MQVKRPYGKLDRPQKRVVVALQRRKRKRKMRKRRKDSDKRGARRENTRGRKEGQKERWKERQNMEERGRERGKYVSLRPSVTGFISHKFPMEGICCNAIINVIIRKNHPPSHIHCSEFR